ncbi:hypothetical protein niasHS_006094 [Heterodera schachtii]|uniref:Uncharacterized protein n=1 Tax=Heterodera schachtii TaxID=97005 RepID=A0ABD2JW12_HETSC
MANTSSCKALLRLGAQGDSVRLTKIASGNNTSPICPPASATNTTTTTDQQQCHQNQSSGSLATSLAAAEDSGSASATTTSSSNSYHSAVSCGGCRAPCCVVPSSLPSSASPSASPSSLSSEHNCLSRAEDGSESSSTKSGGDSSLPSPPALDHDTTIGCTLCQHKQQQHQSVAGQGRASSEETLKRGDSRLTVPRGSASSSQPSPSPTAARYTETIIHRQTATAAVQQQFVEVDRQLNAVVATAKGGGTCCQCEECMLACRREQQQLQHEQQQQQQLAGPSGSGGGGAGRSSGVASGALSIALANAQLGTASSGPTTSSSAGSGGTTQQQHHHHQQQQQQAQHMMMYCNSTGAGPSPLISTNAQTIEEQIKQIDRISKECDNSRKTLEHINRRLDDLNDEVRRYREFLGHEKARRDPTLYKTSTAEPLSSYNDGICRLIDSLTTQLTMEWTEKLRSIQNQTIAKSVAEKG